ncbi:MAG: hypothetical protein ACKO25_11710 [Cyanobium sp.]
MALCQFRNVSCRMVILRCVGPEAFPQEKLAISCDLDATERSREAIPALAA